MKKTLFILLFTLGVFSVQGQETITISGRVTDFEGNPIDSSIVQLMHNDFSSYKEVYTDKDGYYTMPDVEKGKYLALYVIRPQEYPRPDRVPDDQKRLEFWAWNVIADRDLTINPRYHRLELYGVNAFTVQGGLPGMMIYVRPMSLGKHLRYSSELVQNKAEADKVVDNSVALEHFVPRVFIDEEEVQVRLIQPIEEYSPIGRNVPGFLLYVDLPEERPNKPYVIVRIEATNTELNEKGESIYFYALKSYK